MQPTHFDALHLSGLIYAQNRKLSLALDLFSKAIDIKPSFAHALSNRGNVFKELKRFEEALANYDQAISIKPDFADAYYNRGLALIELKRLEEAIASYDRAIQISPNFAEAYSNRGNALIELKRKEEAVASYDRAIEIIPEFAEAHYNRGNALKELKRMEDALACYDKSIEVKPDYAEAYWNKSLSLLLSGEFVRGCILYEWRWKKEDTLENKRNFLQPLWLGADDIAGKTILLHAEQGLGDTIQFCRYAKLVKERGARLLLEVPKVLLGLLSGLEGVDQFVEKGKALPSFDYHCPLMSLPLAFNTTLESIPNNIPYIHSNINNQNKWQERIGGAGFKVAICWQGSIKGKVDVGRSFPVSLFQGLAQIEGVRLISLQKNEGVEQLENLPVGMIVETLSNDFDSGENAFLDSAAVMKCMDLVITSDTALTHLAGALGVKTWLPLKYVPDWRWMLDRSDSPWYPNHRLFRQKTSDDWISVFTEMEKELKSLLSTKSASKQ
jgi:tetratricopeptide (TPR) repeat protein